MDQAAAHAQHADRCASAILKVACVAYPAHAPAILYAGVTCIPNQPLNDGDKRS